jgi:uncharacterized membrane protein
MEYSKDIILGVQYLNEKDKLTGKLKKEKKKRKQERSKGKILEFMNEHKFITSISITCVILMMLDCVLVYSFVELLQRL